MKTTKIAPGYYKFNYKSFNVSINCVSGDITDYNGWVFTYEDKDGLNHNAHDLHSTKKIAIEAAIEYLDYLTK